MTGHAALEDWMRTACDRDGIPVPPTDSELRLAPPDYVFDWRRPKEGEPVGPDTPVSFRWRLRHGRVIVFAAYGWRDSEYQMKMRGANPKISGPFYGILWGDRKTEAVKQELSHV